VREQRLEGQAFEHVSEILLGDLVPVAVRMPAIEGTGGMLGMLPS
jgi:hypothetical protein